MSSEELAKQVEARHQHEASGKCTTRTVLLRRTERAMRRPMSAGSVADPQLSERTTRHSAASKIEKNRKLRLKLLPLAIQNRAAPEIINNRHISGYEAAVPEQHAAVPFGLEIAKSTGDLGKSWRCRDRGSRSAWCHSLPKVGQNRGARPSDTDVLTRPPRSRIAKLPDNLGKSGRMEPGHGRL